MPASNNPSGRHGVDFLAGPVDFDRFGPVRRNAVTGAGRSGGLVAGAVEGDIAPSRRLIRRLRNEQANPSEYSARVYDPGLPHLLAPQSLTKGPASGYGPFTAALQIGGGPAQPERAAVTVLRGRVLRGLRDLRGRVPSRPEVRAPRCPRRRQRAPPQRRTAVPPLCT